MNKRLLTIYLQDHLAAGQGGIELARRIHRLNRGNAVGTLMERIVPELEEEATVLEEILGALGSSPSRSKMSAAWLAEKIGRFKLNGRILGYSPISRLYELEGLSAGVVARQGIWRTLAALVPLYPVLEQVKIQTYADRADRQLDELIETHRVVARVVAGVEEFDHAREQVEHDEAPESPYAGL
jgi:hypothetical protein